MTRIFGPKSEYLDEFLERMAEEGEIEVEAYFADTEGYELSVVFEGLESAEEIMELYNREFREVLPEKNVGVFGNSQDVVDHMIEGEDTFGVARREGEEWAFDAERVMRGYVDLETETPHREALDNLNTAFVATVSHAMDENAGRGGYEFYSDLVEGKYGEQPVKPVIIDVEEEVSEPGYREIVEGTIEDVKNRIRDLENPDFEALLEAEKEGRDRKTLKDYFSDRAED